MSKKKIPSYESLAAEAALDRLAYQFRREVKQEAAVIAAQKGREAHNIDPRDVLAAARVVMESDPGPVLKVVRIEESNEDMPESGD